MSSKIWRSHGFSLPTEVEEWLQSLEDAFGNLRLERQSIAETEFGLFILVTVSYFDSLRLSDVEQSK